MKGVGLLEAGRAVRVFQIGKVLLLVLLLSMLLFLSQNQISEIQKIYTGLDAC